MDGQSRSFMIVMGIAEDYRTIEHSYELSEKPLSLYLAMQKYNCGYVQSSQERIQRIRNGYYSGHITNDFRRTSRGEESRIVIY